MPAPQKPKAVQRTPEQISRDLANERAALEKSFGELREDLTEAVDVTTRKATQVGVYTGIGVAAVAAVGAGVGALVGSAVAVRAVVRRRRGRR